MTLYNPPLKCQSNHHRSDSTMVPPNKKLICLNVSSGIYNVIYLHHQWSDQAHTLQFDSTDEYFETVEYEPRSPLELRDSSRKPLIFLDRSPHIQVYSNSPTHCGEPGFSKNIGCETSNGPSSELRWSWMTKRWLSVSNCDTCSTFSMFLEL